MTESDIHMTSTLADTLSAERQEEVRARPRIAADNAVAGKIMQIPVEVQVVIGSVRLPLSRIAELGQGSLIVMDQKIGAPATILVNGREVAKGELLVMEDDGDRLAIRLTEVAAGSPV